MSTARSIGSTGSSSGRRRPAWARWPLHDAMEAVDLAIDVAVGLENLEKGGPLTQDLLEIGAAHKRER